MPPSSSPPMRSATKPTTKLLLFSLTIPSSLLLCFLVSLLAARTSPTQPHLYLTILPFPPPPLPPPPLPSPPTTNFSLPNFQNGPTPGSSPTHFTEPTAVATNTSYCDVFDGRWVFDETYPLYTDASCPFIDEGFSCEGNGRIDGRYMKWRWQPSGCNVPRFNPVKLLELLKGQRLVFVGDSINRNQWESMICLLSSGVTNLGRIREARGRKITKERGNYSFKFLDYGCSVEYYVSHFLVHEGTARVGRKRARTLRIDRIDRSSSRWRGADILVFNTAHWWSHYKTKAGVNYYQEGDQVHPQLNVSVAFRKALMTWASWVDRHATFSKTKVFFRSSSPSHFRGGEWNSGGHCKESSQPLNGSYFRPNSEKTVILEEVIKQMKTPVTILNITRMSGLRIDAHPSVYGRSPRKGTSSDIEDCSHWCLPGLPDAWNELLYFNLLSRQNASCPFIDEGFSCEGNERINGRYVKWRWQPNGCNVPRFNPVKLMEFAQGKKASLYRGFDQSEPVGGLCSAC